MICKKEISSEKSQDLLDYLESMRLKEESVKNTTVPLTEDKNKVVDAIPFMNDSTFYAADAPFLLCDKNGETIISRTAKGINERKLNPFELNWMAITLYSTGFVRQLLELVDSSFLVDVAQAIDDEDVRHRSEDGPYTNIVSDNYGTGQGNPFSYSYMRYNWENNGDDVSAVSIAEGIIDKRKKAELFRQKIKDNTSEQTNESKRHIIEIIDEPESHLHIDMKESVINQSIVEENKALKEECDRWKKMYEDALSKESEKAFTATGNKCFTKAQMGLLTYTIASITDGPTPVKKPLVPIISSIGGWEGTSVDSEMKKAGFNQKDIDAVAKVFESAMPNFASEIRKQIPRRGKTKK